MAGAKNHDYHILPPSIWPLFGSMSVLIMAVGAIMWMHPDAMPAGGGWVFMLGFAGVPARFRRSTACSRPRAWK